MNITNYKGLDGATCDGILCKVRRCWNGIATHPNQSESSHRFIELLSENSPEKLIKYCSIEPLNKFIGSRGIYTSVAMLDMIMSKKVSCVFFSFLLV